MLNLLLDALFPQRSLTGEYGCLMTEQERRDMTLSFPLRFEATTLRARGVRHLDRLVAVGSYASSPLLRRAIYTWKYGRIAAMGEELGKLLERAVPLLGFSKSTAVDNEHCWKGTDVAEGTQGTDVLGEEDTLASSVSSSVVLCPVPLHWVRKFARGFNQAVILAEAASRATGWSVQACLRRRVPTGFQARRRRGERRRAMRGAFTCIVDLSPPCIVLVDDVSTTGSTLDECARVLKEHGTHRVEGLVLAQG